MLLEIERRHATREPLERSIMCDSQSLDQDLVAVLCCSQNPSNPELVRLKRIR